MAAWSICGAPVDAEGKVLDVLVQNGSYSVHETHRDLADGNCIPVRSRVVNKNGSGNIAEGATTNIKAMWMITMRADA